MSLGLSFSCFSFLLTKDRGLPELHFANALVTLVPHVYIDIFEIHIDLLLGDTKVQ